jgi:hypothetical protein
MANPSGRTRAILEQHSRNQTQEPYTVCQSAGPPVRRFTSFPVRQFASSPVHRFSGRNEERTDREES